MTILEFIAWVLDLNAWWLLLPYITLVYRRYLLNKTMKKLNMWIALQMGLHARQIKESEK